MQIVTLSKILLSLILILPLCTTSAQQATTTPLQTAPPISDPDPTVPFTFSISPSSPASEPGPPTPIPVPRGPRATPVGGSVSIEDVQRLGLEANGLVKAAKSQVGMAEGGVIGAAAYPNPQVSVIGGPQHPRIPAANPATNTRQVTVTQNIENPFL